MTTETYNDPTDWTDEQREAVAAFRAVAKAFVEEPSADSHAALQAQGEQVFALGIDPSHITPVGYGEELAGRVVSELTGMTVGIRRLLPFADGREPLLSAAPIGEGVVAGRNVRVSTAQPSGSIVVEFAKEEGDETKLGRDRFIILLDDVLASLDAKLSKEDKAALDEVTR